jgi:hypothetical protein
LSFPDTNKNNFFILLASFSTLVYITSYLIDLWTYRKPEKTQLSIAHWQVELQEKTTAISVESNKKYILKQYHPQNIFPHQFYFEVNAIINLDNDFNKFPLLHSLQIENKNFTTLI